MVPPRSITFYSPANNGDVHACRELVKYSMRRVREKYGDIPFTFAHRNDPGLLRDIPDLQHRGIDGLSFDGDRMSDCRDGDYIWNTWYAVSPTWAKGRGSGITLYTLIELFRKHLQSVGIALEGQEADFIPSIQYPTRISSSDFRTCRWVLFCANPIRSGQSRVDDATLLAVLGRLARERPDVLFFNTSSEYPIDLPNVLDANAVLGVGGCNLNETAALGASCNVIVGRCSGPHTFCLNRDILLDETKTYISLTTSGRLGQWTTAAKAKMLWSDATDVETLCKMIGSSLSR